MPKKRSQCISDDQFLVDIINKEFELANIGVSFNSKESLLAYCKIHSKWFSEHYFPDVEAEQKWKTYVIQHFKETKKRRKMNDNEFSWINLQYGFSVKK